MVRLSVLTLFTVRLDICISSTLISPRFHVVFVFFLYKYNVTNNGVNSLLI